MVYYQIVSTDTHKQEKIKRLFVCCTFKIFFTSKGLAQFRSALLETKQGCCNNKRKSLYVYRYFLRKKNRIDISHLEKNTQNKDT